MIIQLQEEEEQRRQEREANLFASLGSQGVPTFGLEVSRLRSHVVLYTQLTSVKLCQDWVGFTNFG